MRRVVSVAGEAGLPRLAGEHGAVALRAQHVGHRAHAHRDAAARLVDLEVALVDAVRQPAREEGLRCARRGRTRETEQCGRAAYTTRSGSVGAMALCRGRAARTERDGEQNLKP